MAVNLGDIEQIAEHLANGGEPENVISDLEALGQRDPDLFTSMNGMDARMAIDDAKVYMEDNKKERAYIALSEAVEKLKAKYQDGEMHVPGGRKRRRKTKKSRRGRKSRRKSLRQRK